MIQMLFLSCLLIKYLCPLIKLTYLSLGKFQLGYSWDKWDPLINEKISVQTYIALKSLVSSLSRNLDQKMLLNISKSIDFAY